MTAAAMQGFFTLGWAGFTLYLFPFEQRCLATVDEQQYCFNMCIHQTII